MNKIHLHIIRFITLSNHDTKHNIFVLIMLHMFDYFKDVRKVMRQYSFIFEDLTNICCYKFYPFKYTMTYYYH